MQIVEKTATLARLTQRRPGIGKALLLCFSLSLLFFALDAKHPKAKLNCERHAVLPGAQVEDIDCALEVRPTRTALDLRLHEEVSYSFELVRAYLERVPRKEWGLGCQLVCDTSGCFCKGSNRGRGRVSNDSEDPQQREGEEGDRKHHHVHNLADVATLILEDNQGNTYVYYTFSDLVKAEEVLETINGFIVQARSDLSHGDGQGSNMETLRLGVLHDDSWADEILSIFFLLAGLALMLLPHLERVVIDAGSGMLSIQRVNGFRLAVFSYACTLENVSMLQVSETEVYIMSAYGRIGQSLRLRKEYTLEVVFSSAPCASRPPAGQERGQGGISSLPLCLGIKATDDAQLKRVAEAANDVIQRYVYENEAPGLNQMEGQAVRACCICISRPARVVLFPCKHLSTCARCAEHLKDCPICRTVVTERHEVFL